MKRILQGLYCLLIAAAVVISAYFLATMKGPVITIRDIENNKGQFTVIYNEDGTIHSLDGDLKGAKIKSEEDARKVIDNYRELFQLPNTTEYRCINIQESITGTAYMYIQTFAGIDIAGTYISLITDDNVLTAITVNIDRDIESIVARRLTDKEINKVISSEYGDRYRVYTKRELILNNKLVYHVYLVNKEDIFTLDDRVVFIDAETKTLKTEQNISAERNMFDSYYNKEEIYSNFTYNDIEYLYDLERKIQIVDMREDNNWPLNKKECDGHLIAENTFVAGENELAAAVYINLAKTYDWYQDNYHRNSYDDNNGEIICLVGLDIFADNAAYWPTLNIFAVGEANVYDIAPATLLDVTAHEFTHAVFQSITGRTTIRNSETEGISEAYADIFGCLIDGDWILAEGIVEGKALSDLSDSGIETLRRKKSPETYKDSYWSNTDGHLNSVILTEIAYEMIQNGFTEREVADIWYQSMFYGYSDNSTYLTVKHNIVKAARALGHGPEQIELIEDLFSEVEIK